MSLKLFLYIVLVFFIEAPNVLCLQSPSEDGCQPHETDCDEDDLRGPEPPGSTASGIPTGHLALAIGLPVGFLAALYLVIYHWRRKKRKEIKNIEWSHNHWSGTTENAHQPEEWVSPTQQACHPAPQHVHHDFTNSPSMRDIGESISIPTLSPTRENSSLPSSPMQETHATCSGQAPVVERPSTPNANELSRSETPPPPYTLESHDSSGYSANDHSYSSDDGPTQRVGSTFEREVAVNVA
ncbi:hypothetical protein AAF712_004942 [Marasmius tenuissimus]|uniref:Uncharacterized protein n=1 Tax=Marasmius tenuissimus TaxID=585030 RepID=A0ABR3A3Z3_9AGAR|nr:hypothetical protein PM082_014143 [Marasmius tenuissimus]